MKSKYTEALKLKDLLDKNNIPYQYKINNIGIGTFGIGERHHIQVPNSGEKRIISIVQGEGTYGSENNLLEIMGLLTKEEKQKDNVVGCLSAENVLQRILKYYNKKKG